MKTYHEKTGVEIESPDLEKGYTYPGQRYVGTERVILKGTVELSPPDGLGYEKAVYEDCQWYHEYTEDELAAMHPPDEPQPSDMEERLKAVEDELQAAKILLGVERVTLTDLARQLRPLIERAETSLDDADALQGVPLFPAWAAGLAVAKDARYQHGGTLYRCVQAHTTQDGWEPDKTPALWAAVSEDPQQGDA